MAAIVRALIIFVLMAVAESVMTQQTDAAIDCTDPIVSLSPCLSYMTRSAKLSIPDDDCCDSLATVINTHAGCLCELVSRDDFLGFPINQTITLSLPSTCDIQYPRELDQCIVVLPPSSDGPVVQPGSNPPPRLFHPEAPSPALEAVPPVLEAPPMESVPDQPDDSPFPNVSIAGALFTQSLLRLFWGSLH
uniref:LTP_2 domain-containing protein n=1 Tax=Cryptomeria japonica TaxID=3369 RepID=A0A7G1HHK1_CRYJA|nr:LTP_2 domain-containing protein [Cryptomeria japonica]